MSSSTTGERLSLGLCNLDEDNEKAVRKSQEMALLSEFISTQRSIFQLPHSASGNISTVDKFAQNCLSLQFLVDFFREVVEPLDPKNEWTTKAVIDKLLKPYTKDRGGGSVMDVVTSSSANWERPNAIFISHSSDNVFGLLVQSLKEFFIDYTKWSETFLSIDIFLIDPNKITCELQNALRKSSGSVLVVINGKAHRAEELLNRLDEVRNSYSSSFLIITFVNPYLNNSNSVLRHEGLLQTYPAPYIRNSPCCKSCLASVIRCSSWRTSIKLW
eukprot:gene41050-55492_t